MRAKQRGASTAPLLGILALSVVLLTAMQSWTTLQAPAQQPRQLAAAPVHSYAQARIHDASGAVYTITGDALTNRQTHAANGVDIVYCLEIGGAVGGSPSRGDVIFHDSFELPDLCWED